SLQDEYIIPFRDAKSERLTYFTGPNVFAGLSTFLFAYIGQHASFEVYRSLKYPSFSRWKIIANSAVSLAGILCILVSVSSWLNLGESIQPNIMDTFGPSDAPTLCAKFLLAITMNLTYPVENFVCRRNLNQGIFVDLLGMSEYMPFWRHVFITLGIWVVSLAICKCTASVHYFPIAIINFCLFCIFLQHFCLLT
ncbi:MAG: hypothetical protein GY775_21145, partial [Candidatus Scalindua sp.]|nr:hypothetical protein [Candidatus Scalindua sp.]